MNILEHLTKIANMLDKKGLYEEADELDALVKNAISHQAEKDVLEMIKDNPGIELKDLVALLDQKHSGKYTGFVFDIVRSLAKKNLIDYKHEGGDSLLTKKKDYFTVKQLPDEADDKPRDPTGPQPSNPPNLFPTPKVGPVPLPPKQEQPAPKK